MIGMTLGMSLESVDPSELDTHREEKKLGEVTLTVTTETHKDGDVVQMSIDIKGSVTFPGQAGAHFLEELEGLLEAYGRRSS